MKPVSALHRLDERMVTRLQRFAFERYGEAWLEVELVFESPYESLQLMAPWSVYGFDIDGATIAEHYLQAPASRLSTDEKSWLRAQQQSWLSVWEVQAVVPGASLDLCDLLTGERRHIHEASGSQSLARRDVILGRIVEHRGERVLCGVHQRFLGPRAADSVVQRCRKRLRLKRNVPIERIRNGKFAAFLIEEWELAVAEEDAVRDLPPVLHNTDGDLLLITIDHFEFQKPRRKEIEQALFSIQGVQEPDEDGSYSVLRDGNAMHKSWDNTVVGRIELKENALRIETNSIPRADRLRSEVETGLGRLIKYRIREHADLTSMMKHAEHGKAQPRIAPNAEALETLNEMKRAHYAGWLDSNIPALGGRTPRLAARTQEGRRQVDLLLREAESHEARLPAAERFDFSDLRRELGILVREK